MSIELAAAPDFEETAEKLEELLVAGLHSGEPIEADKAYWNRLREETERIAADQARTPLP